MTKTLALLLDSYRELNAKRLFWIVLVISALVVAAFSLIGIKGGTITVLWWDTPFTGPALSMLKPAMLYKLMFSFFGVGFWLTWLANILALISTAGIFPDFMAGGSVDLYLSKPISRLRLFLTKYIGGLLFVTLQVAVFSTCSFFLIGFRGHQWEPAIFLSIPLVVLVFSYLFSICVLLGVLTRSTIASLLLTLLVWFVLWGVQTTETALLVASIQSTVHAESLDRQIVDARAELAAFPTSAPSGSTSQPATPAVAQSSHHSRGPLGFFTRNPTRADVQARLDTLQSERGGIGTGIQTAHRIAFAALAPLPKNHETIDLLDRQLIKRAELPNSDNDDANGDQGFGNDTSFGEDHAQNRREFRERLEADQHSRTAGWILGTSLAFELVMMVLSAWLFCRRDY